MKLSKSRLESMKKLERARRFHGGLHRALLSGDMNRVRKWQRLVLKEVSKLKPM